MNDPLVISFIRTVVPIAVGQIGAFLAAKGLDIDKNSLDGLQAFLGGLISSLYYLVVRVLERKYPKAGVLLGIAAKPTYK